MTRSGESGDSQNQCSKAVCASSYYVRSAPRRYFVCISAVQSSARGIWISSEWSLHELYELAYTSTLTRWASGMKPTDDLQNHMGGIDRGSLEEGVSCIHGSAGFDELSVQHCPADSRRQDEFERRGQGKE